MIYLLIALLAYFLIWFWLKSSMALVIAGQAAGKWDHSWKVSPTFLLLEEWPLRLTFSAISCLAYYVYTLC